MGTFMTCIPRCVHLGIGVIMGSVIKSARIYAYGIVQSARWVFLGTSVRIQPESERRGLDSDTSAEKTHLARGTMPYACSGTPVTLNDYEN